MLSNNFYKGVGKNGVRGEWGTFCDFLFAFLDDETLFKCGVYPKRTITESAPSVLWHIQ